MHVLLIDNNDSFTHNLDHLLAGVIVGAQIHVASYAQLPTLDLTTPDIIVISPGPGTPAEHPGYERVIQANKPILGVCLGMQILNELHGGTTGRLSNCVHGKTDSIHWQDEKRIVARYHSLYVTQLAADVQVLATNKDDVPMIIGNHERRILGYQFHPESFLTPDGGRFIVEALDFLGLG